MTFHPYLSSLNNRKTNILNPTETFSIYLYSFVSDKYIFPNVIRCELFNMALRKYSTFPML